MGVRETARGMRFTVFMRDFLCMNLPRTLIVDTQRTTFYQLVKYRQNLIKSVENTLTA